MKAQLSKDINRLEKALASDFRRLPDREARKLYHAFDRVINMADRFLESVPEYV